LFFRLFFLSSKEELLKRCFWRLDAFKEFGLFVLCFYKDCNLVFVLVDDRIPVYKKTGKVVFAQCKDPNELWVPLIEKAYAKLHGCYKALIGGYSHYALGDMTGFSPRLIGLKEGYMGFSDKLSAESVWEMLWKYIKEWNSLLGCSIQSKASDGPKVEADAGNGLIMGHAYSFLDLNVVKLKTGKEVRLVKVRNPWGKGEWEGPWGDRSDEYEEHEDAIKAAFSHTGDHEVIEKNSNDGTFFMTFEDWFSRYTSVFVAVNFPDSWIGERVTGNWTGDEGGSREMVTWVSNPKIKMTFESDKPAAQVFIGLYINDSRLVMGIDYFKHPLYATALAFDVVTDEELVNATKNLKKADLPKNVPDALTEVLQPPYMFGTTQLEVTLKTNTSYYVVPSLWKRNQPGLYYVTVFSDTKFSLEGGVRITAENSPLERPRPPLVEKASARSRGGSARQDENTAPKAETMTTSQFLEKKERLREKLLGECKRLGLTISKFETILGTKNEFSYPVFKRKMLDMGFSLIDLPDDDLKVIFSLAFT
jgi:Calpain family cysteine protease